MKNYAHSHDACTQASTSSFSNILADAHLTGQAIQAQLLAMEDSIVDGHGIQTDLMVAWLFAMREQLKQMDFAIVATLCQEGDHHG